MKNQCIFYDIQIEFLYVIYVSLTHQMITLILYDCAVIIISDELTAYTGGTHTF
jgi:hypothetical protein